MFPFIRIAVVLIRQKCAFLTQSFVFQSVWIADLHQNTFALERRELWQATSSFPNTR